MGQPQQGSQETTDEQLKGYINNLDAFTGATTRNIPQTEQALLDARRQFQPANQELDYQIAQQYLPKFTQLGIDQQAQQQAGTAAADTRLLQGQGQDLVRANLEAQKIADPEFYKTRAGTADQLSRLMGSLDDPNGGLSPTERMEIERSLARTNSQRGIEAPTATSAVESAMNFGKAGADRKANKQQAINSAVQTAGQLLPGLKSGVDVLQLTTGRPSMANQGLNKYGDNAQVGGTSLGLGSQLMSQIGENSRQTADINSKKRTPFDTAIGIGNTTANIMGSI